jgi:hypothetical protein
MLRNYIHDCNNCKFLGVFDGHDLYSCVDTVLARHSDDGPDYKSCPDDIPTSDAHLLQARRWRADESMEVLLPRDKVKGPEPWA